MVTRFALLLLALAAPAVWAASAQETVIYNFATTPGDAERPAASLTLGPDGNFYGTSQGGGPFLAGTVFKITPGGVESVLYSFGSVPDDGGHPTASLTLASDGAFYGTTRFAAQNNGSVFRISMLGVYEQLYAFALDGTDGDDPFGSLAEGTDGNLYGTTLNGGPYQGFSGTLFRISKAGAYSQLYTFGLVPSDGQWPFAGLTLGGDGNLYGTTYFSGPRQDTSFRNGAGTVFTFVPGQGLSTIYDFNNATTCGGDGAAPSASLTLGLDGNLYGVTEDGGRFRQGAIFMITPGGKETVLYSFGSIPSDGRNPTGSLIRLADGTLLGTTPSGGANESSDNAGGTAFMLAPDGTYTLLHSFGATATDGQYPYGGLTQGPDGNFYGTTVAGGSTTDRANGNVGAGTVYKLVIDNGGTGAPTFHSTPVPQYGCRARSSSNKGGPMGLGLIVAALGALSLRRRLGRRGIR